MSGPANAGLAAHTNNTEQKNDVVVKRDANFEPVTRDTIEIKYFEKAGPDFGSYFTVSNIIHSSKSNYQDTKIIESPKFGRCLILDGKIQSSSYDEFIYHESLVHLSMLCHRNPARVFVGGGGEFATCREILKHESVEEVVMCDLDKHVCDIAREYLPEMAPSQMFSDERLKVVYGDARAELFRSESLFDVVIMDIADPIEAGPGIACYYQDFYKRVKDVLSEDGVFVTQSGAADLSQIHECFPVIHSTLGSVFPEVLPFSAYVPSFYAQWGFNIGVKKRNQTAFVRNPEVVGKRLVERIGKENAERLRFFDGETCLKMVSLNKYQRACLEKEKRVMTKETPVFMY